ncbi:MAG: hypothetical protein CL610_06170 [Anaerolineaceae bacterium]|nr:hypothetical protein [Anaerolineaceae bacterium]
MRRHRIAPGQLALPLVWDMPPQRSLSPFERGPVVRVLQELNRWRRGPVISPLLADHLGISERTARLYLARLEREGLVQRPHGPRSGWMVCHDRRVLC